MNCLQSLMRYDCSPQSTQGSQRYGNRQQGIDSRQSKVLGVKRLLLMANYNSQPFGPEPFGHELKAELLMADERSLR